MAHSRGIRAERGDHAARQRLREQVQPLEHARACEVEIDVVLEDDIDHREAEGRRGAHHTDAGQPLEAHRQRVGDLVLHLLGLPGVRVVRSSSAFGFSMINVIFEDDVDLYFARSRVLERLNLLAKSLPAGVVPTLGPDAMGGGHVFWYTVEGKGVSLRYLRLLQDWFIRYQLNSVAGVAEGASIGGTVRQYQIDVDPNRLRAYRVPLSAAVDAVLRSNRNAGGNVDEASGTWSVVRGLGLIESTRDLEEVVVGAENGVPIFVRQVADVKLGDAFRAAAL